jgi:RNA polymerase sigma-70 factor (ECF subfamily)
MVPMARLRLVRSDASPSPKAESGCLDAFQRELDYLYMTLQRLGAGPGEIDDLLQEIFLVLYRHWPSLDLARPLRPWLFGVTFRVLRAQRRRRAREVLCADFELEDGASSPESLLAAREALVSLSAALDRVPLARRSVVVLHDLEGVEIVEIARRLSMTKIGVYTRLYKGRRELAAALRRLQRKAVA